MKLILVLEHDNGDRQQLGAVTGQPEFLGARLQPVLEAMAGPELIAKMKEAQPDVDGVTRVVAD